MDTQTETPLDAAIRLAGGKTALMRLLNDKGHTINSHSVITHWQANGTPTKYCPDIEGLTGVKCEALDPLTNWSVIRNTAAKPTRAGN